MLKRTRHYISPQTNAFLNIGLFNLSQSVYNHLIYRLAICKKKNLSGHVDDHHF